MRRVLVLLLLTMTATGATTAELAPAPRAVTPVISFVSASKTPTGLVRITLQVTNDADKAVQFQGYRADSFNPPLPKGRIEPLWIAESQRNGTWEYLRWRSTSCGFGLDLIDLPAGATATFEVELPGEQWNEAQIGVHFLFADKTVASRTVVITRQQVEKSVPEAPAPRPRKE